MAKAGKATSTDWISLRDARDLAAKALGSKAGAQEQLLEWMATGELPWTCTRWKAPTAEDIARMNQTLVVISTPQIVYRKGDSQFMADGPDIDWEDNSACEASYLPDGARAWGIMVSRAHLQTLLPDINLASTADGHGVDTTAFITAEAKRMKAEGEIPDGITKAKFARLLEGQIMVAARRGDVVKRVGYRHIANNLKNWGLWPVSSIK